MKSIVSPQNVVNFQYHAIIRKLITPSPNFLVESSIFAQNRISVPLTSRNKNTISQIKSSKFPQLIPDMQHPYKTVDNCLTRSHSLGRINKSIKPNKKSLRIMLPELKTEDNGNFKKNYEKSVKNFQSKLLLLDNNNLQKQNLSKNQKILSPQRPKKQILAKYRSQESKVPFLAPFCSPQKILEKSTESNSARNSIPKKTPFKLKIQRIKKQKISVGIETENTLKSDTNFLKFGEVKWDNFEKISPWEIDENY